MASLYHKYRPTKFNQVVGQSKCTTILNNYVKRGNVPHALLFKGPSGCGKTTLARILKSKLKCSDYDFQEMNAADRRGIDDIREIRERMTMAPIGGNCRVFLIDEAHKLSGDAQSALLKMLEDTPESAYFMLATTDPEKLIPTIRTRCTDITVNLLTYEDMMTLLTKVAKKEKLKFEEEVYDKIIDIAEGSARKALVFLDAIQDLEDTEQMLEYIERGDETKQAIDLCRLLFNYKGKPGWAQVATMLQQMKGVDCEKVRWAVLGYARSILLGKNANMSARAYVILEAFSDNFYDSKDAGLAKACYEVIHN